MIFGNRAGLLLMVVGGICPFVIKDFLITLEMLKKGQPEPDWLSRTMR